MKPRDQEHHDFFFRLVFFHDAFVAEVLGHSNGINFTLGPLARRSGASNDGLVEDTLERCLCSSNINWLVVSTHLKNISQIGSFPQAGVKIKIFETTTQSRYISLNHNETDMIYTPGSRKTIFFEWQFPLKTSSCFSTVRVYFIKNFKGLFGFGDRYFYPLCSSASWNHNMHISKPLHKGLLQSLEK